MMTNTQRVHQGDPLYQYDVLHADTGEKLGGLTATSHDHALAAAKRSYGASVGGKKAIKVKRAQ